MSVYGPIHPTHARQHLKCYAKTNHISGINAMARPTKYNQEILEKAQHYLDNYEEYDEVIPSAVGLALALNITRSTLYEWAKDEDKKEFSDILDNINKRQEQILLKNGLTNQFNSNITKLVLGKHGYTDRAQQSDTQVHVIIHRDRVAIQAGDETLSIENDSPKLVES